MEIYYEVDYGNTVISNLSYQEAILLAKEYLLLHPDCKVTINRVMREYDIVKL